MSKKSLVAVLVGINIAIVLVIILLPKQEWMNLLVVVFVANLAYLFHLLHVHFLSFTDERKGTLLKALLGKIGLGLLLSGISMGVILVTISLLGGFSEGETFIPFHQGEEQTANGFIDVILLYASSALAEETVFRSFCIGVLMIPIALLSIYLMGRHGKSRDEHAKRNLTFIVGMVWNLLVALLFGIVHKDSPGFGVISFLNIAVSGAIYGYIFIIQKDIICAWSMHFSWNMIQIFVGVPVSGKYLPSVSLAGDLFRGARDNIVAGGSYGPEGSVVTLLIQLCLAAILFKYLKYPTND